MGKGRSPTGPVEAAGPRRCLEVRAILRAQAGFRVRRRPPFSRLWSPGWDGERPLRAQSGSRASGLMGAFGGSAAFWEM